MTVLMGDSAEKEKGESAKNVEISSSDDDANPTSRPNTTATETTTTTTTKRHEDIYRLIFEHKGGKVELYTTQLKCLEPGAYLIDSIIQFYAAYLLNDLCSESVISRVHIFDNMFYNSLDATIQPKDFDMAKFNKLSKWSSFDLFKKDFLLFPLCKDDHWMLIVVCYPGEVRPVEEFIKNPLDYRDKKFIGKKRVPGFIVMDSLKRSNPRATMKLREFLDFSWRKRVDEPLKSFSHTDLEDYLPSLPKQKNEFDCGIYMLAYMRAFLENPDEFYELTRATDDVSAKGLRMKVRACLRENDREAIRKLIKSKCRADGPLIGCSSYRP